MRALIAMTAGLGLILLGCEGGESPSPPPTAATKPAAVQHRSNLPPLHPNNIVSIASASKDHTTLVVALQAADYVTSVAASGPLTVFAPTNAAFEALPAGTVEGLLEPESADQLREILKYHVTTSSLAVTSFRDGQSLGMANGAKATLHVDGEQVSINDAVIIASIPATNGMIHVIDGVLLPPE
jgi:uncharacterized surface protein with fasciclin (FAS1) repeats